jgi:hypothetical protein
MNTRISPALRATLVMLLVTGVGVLGGVALDRFVLLPRGTMGWHHGGPNLLREASPEQEEAMRRRFGARLGRVLELTPVQSVRVDSLLDRKVVELRNLRRDVGPRLQQLMSSFRDSLDALLTPAQRERFREMRKRRGSPD